MSPLTAGVASPKLCVGRGVGVGIGVAVGMAVGRGTKSGAGVIATVGICRPVCHRTICVSFSPWLSPRRRTSNWPSAWLIVAETPGSKPSTPRFSSSALAHRAPSHVVCWMVDNPFPSWLRPTRCNAPLPSATSFTGAPTSPKPGRRTGLVHVSPASDEWRCHQSLWPFTPCQTRSTRPAPVATTCGQPNGPSATANGSDQLAPI